MFLSLPGDRFTRCRRRLRVVWGWHFCLVWVIGRHIFYWGVSIHIFIFVCCSWSEWRGIYLCLWIIQREGNLFFTFAYWCVPFRYSFQKKEFFFSFTIILFCRPFFWRFTIFTSLIWNLKDFIFIFFICNSFC